jgi:uncharacterized protein (TIRG00374 family)
LKRIKKIVPYLLSASLSVWFVQYAFRDLSFATFRAAFTNLHFGWLFLSALLGLAGHLLRAYRWKLLLEPLGFTVTLFKSYMTLMVGYMTNLLVPRLGTLLRLSLLSRIGNIPLGIVFGTFAIERIMDLLSFIVVVFLTLLFCSAAIQSLLQQIPIPTTLLPGMSWWPLWALGAVLSSTIGWLLYRQYGKKVIEKIIPFLYTVKEGLYGIRLSKRKGAIAYLTFFKWVLYYLSDYIGLLALPEAAQLNWKAGLALLCMSTISFVAPVQGGIGAYHLLISGVLRAYGVTEKYALLYATLMHATHVVSITVVGLIGVATTRISTKKVLNIS